MPTSQIKILLVVGKNVCNTHTAKHERFCPMKPLLSLTVLGQENAASHVKVSPVHDQSACAAPQQLDGAVWLRAVEHGYFAHLDWNCSHRAYVDGTTTRYRESLWTSSSTRRFQIPQDVTLLFKNSAGHGVLCEIETGPVFHKASLNHVVRRLPTPRDVSVCSRSSQSCCTEEFQQEVTRTMIGRTEDIVVKSNLCCVSIKESM